MRALIDADRLPGQPHCTPERLAAARRGPVPTADLAISARPQISVLADAEDRPLGIIAYLSWTDVRTGVIDWLHAREHFPSLRVLLSHALAALTHCPRIEAFVSGPPGPLGPGGLPRTHRRATHDALLHTGFTGRRQGCYLQGVLPTEPPPTEMDADVLPCDCPPGHRLIIREDAEPVAEAVVSVEPDRTAIIYWIETRPTHRRRGLGHKLLSQALALLAEHGATEVALVVDDTSPTTSECRAASRLFDSFGFTYIDELWTYQHRRP